MVLAEYAVAPVDRPRSLLRGLRGRCPLCGSGGLFRHGWRMAERCPHCDLRFERVEGHWIGAIGLNTILSFGLLLLTIVVGLVLTYPDPPFWPLALAALTVAVVVPLAFHPVSRTLWTAIDLCLRPIEPHEIS